MTSSAPNITGGYVLIARKILESELMDKPPHYLKLWTWMLCKAFWKDGEKLKRGQFHTTIAEMQEAMSYKVGFRKITPTKEEIRSAYEAFTKATMITTTKATRGMVITICNYDAYQNPQSYEAHSETHNEAPMNPTGKMKKEKKEEVETKTLSSSGDEAPAGGDVFLLTKRKRKISGKRLQSFNLFWEAFGYKKGKAEAMDAWLDIPELTGALVTRIVAVAKRECALRPDLQAQGRTPKMAQGWLTGRRWEDEDVPEAQAPLKGAPATTLSPVTAEESERINKARARYGTYE